MNNLIDNNTNSKKIKIIDIKELDDYIFMTLNNEQKILTNGQDFYDVSTYDNCFKIFSIKGNLCAFLTRYSSSYVVDLKTKEVLFEDKKAYYISKVDEKALRIIMHIGYGNTNIYNIETKKYLAPPNNYEFNYSLGSNLYVFREKEDYKNPRDDYKSCIINVSGKILMKEIEGWVHLVNNHLIINNKDELRILKMKEDETLEIKTIKQNEAIIAPPDYYEGNIIIMERKAIKIYTEDLEVVDTIPIDELEKVIDHEIIDGILKLCLPHEINNKIVNKHLFINLKTKKSLSHIRIQGYPYWNPKTYIGRDSITPGITNYHFYDEDFNPIIDVLADTYESVGGNDECTYLFRTNEGDNQKRQFLNSFTRNLKDIDYDYIEFPYFSPFGYGINSETETIDFFDEDLKVLFSNIDYKKLNLDYRDLDYFIINDYICFHNHFTDGYGEPRCREIIQNKAGKIILNSLEARCFPIGNFIKIDYPYEDSQFLDTTTGEISPLVITSPLIENRKIDFSKITDTDNVLSVTATNLLGDSQHLANDPKKFIKKT